MFAQYLCEHLLFFFLYLLNHYFCLYYLLHFKMRIAVNLQQLQQRIPPVGDKALIDFVNGIQVNKDLIRYRKNRGFFGQIFDGLTGSDRQRQLLLDGNLIAGQETLHQWVLELTDSLRISQIGLQITQESLLEARNAIGDVKKHIQQQEDKLDKLINLFSSIYDEINDKFNEIYSRIHRLEIRVSANEDLDRIITAWTAGQTYYNLPWPIQVILLAKETFSSAVLTYELETEDLTRFRPLLVNKILAHCQELPQKSFSLADLLDYSWKETKTDDLSLCASLLEVRSIPQARLFNTPLLFTMGTTLELANLPEEAKVNNPGKSAVALCRCQIDSIYRTTDAKEFITNIVEEIANDYLGIIKI
jgi:hypothetical protein